ncbi:MAG: solute-binding protein [Oliverpabstia sp.]|nr:solute-binding protein [Lachnospiraceae bacterium]MDY5026012.1 solute-binding protein [Oliverpabstia sp.]
MGKKKKKDTAYRAVVSGAKGVLRILVYICAVLLIVFAGKTAYSFGYLIFDDHPMAETKEEGQDVTVIVGEDDDVYQIGQTLEEKGLIERPVIFWVQEKLSDYRGKIQPGTYILNTSQNAEEMLAILSGENTEGQPTSDDAGEVTGE